MDTFNFNLKGNLTGHHFREWWRRVVPKVMRPSSSMDYKSPLAHIDDQEVSRMLLEPLHQFICGEEDDADPAQGLERICSLNDPPSQCGKLFKMGEPVYSCRDCGHDPT